MVNQLKEMVKPKLKTFLKKRKIGKKKDRVWISKLVAVHCIRGLIEVKT